MRKEFSSALLEHSENPKVLFLTGDLGFMAFEEVEQKIGERFINMGISEQNMISVAASLAYKGFIPLVYSIAPFLISRPFEQIRNEVGMHRMPVKLIGNGGGYGYGIMGSTHHTLEDIALMRSVNHMKIFLPVYNNDIAEILPMMLADKDPNYLRLNNSINRPENTGPFSAWRQISKGSGPVVIGAGPVLLNAEKINGSSALDLNTWSLGMIPSPEFPAELVNQINSGGKVIVIEEHYKAGGIAEMISHELLTDKRIDKTQLDFSAISAEGYLSGLYGDQQFHQEENGLSGEPLMAKLQALKKH